MFYTTNIVGLLVLILDILAIVSVIRSRMDPVMKLVWILVILFLPFIGMLLYFLLGNKR